MVEDEVVRALDANSIGDVIDAIGDLLIDTQAEVVIQIVPFFALETLVRGNVVLAVFDFDHLGLFGI